MNNGTLYPIIINSGDLISNSFNNTYRYNFPQGSVTFKNSKVALTTVNMYYSWYNITTNYNNTSFQIIWPIGAGTSTYNVIMPNGFYDVSALNDFIQQFCITNGLYLIDASGNFVYYIELLENASYYSVQLNCYGIPTSLPSGYSQPSNWVGYPAVAYTPQLVILSTNNFGNIIGFNSGTYPAAQQTTTFSKLSDFTPQVTPIQSILVACTLLNNKYSNPSTILYTFTSGGTAFGNLISSSPNQYSFVDIQDGQYTNFDVQFLDQDFNKIFINDTNVTISLEIYNPKS